MVTLKKYNLDGVEVGQVTVDERLINAEANGQMIKDYIVAIRENARQWSANTKTRAEVKHTTKKPHPQKGQGRARHGSLVGPQYRGGGRVFSPKPKFDQHVKINQKEKRAAIRFLLSEKFKENRIRIIENTQMELPKTSRLASLLNVFETKKSVLVLGESSFLQFEAEGNNYKFNISSDQHYAFSRSLRNIPKTKFKLASNISGYDVLVAHDIVMTEAALNELKEWLS